MQQLRGRYGELLENPEEGSQLRNFVAKGVLLGLRELHNHVVELSRIAETEGEDDGEE